MEAVEDIPRWKVVLTAHAITRVKARFKLPDTHIQEFVEDQLSLAGPGRKRRGGVLRWTAPTTQIVGRYTPKGIEVITCYPKPKGRGWTKKRKETWRTSHE